MTRREIAQHMVVVGDTMMTAEQWGIQNRIGLDTMQQRLRSGWSWPRIVTRPVRLRAAWSLHTITLEGKTQTIAKWAVAKGLAISVVYYRTHELGWSFSRALTTPIRPHRKHRAR